MSRVPMSTLTMPNGKTYEIVDRQARNNIARNCAPAIVKQTAGISATTNDSSTAQLRGLTIYGSTTQRTTTGKNMLRVTATSATRQGITYTVYDDGVVVANGTATDVSTLILNSAFSFEAGVSYTLSGCPSGGSSTTYRIDDTGLLGDDGAGVTATYSEVATHQIRIRIAAGVTVTNLVFKPMICLSTETDTTFEPYTGGAPSPSPTFPQEIRGVENTTINVVGKNLLPSEYVFIPNAGDSHVAAGATFTNNGDGGIAVSGTPTAYAGGTICSTYMLTHDVTLKLLGTFSNVVMDINLYDEYDRHLKGFVSKTEWTILKADHPGKVRMNISIKRGANDSVMSGIVYPMMVAGTESPLSYEPYVEPQIMEVNHILHGVYNELSDMYKTSYIDDSGVSYIADSIEYVSDGYGKSTSRFWFITLTGEEDISVYRADDNTDTYFGFQVVITSPSIMLAYYQKCSHFINGTATTQGYYPNTFLVHSNGSLYIRTEIEGVTSVETFKDWLAAQYEAGTPVQVLALRSDTVTTALTDSENEEFEQLTTNYPNTTIENSHGAWMEMTYGADTQIYLDNLPKATNAEILAALDAYFAANNHIAEGVSF